MKRVAIYCRVSTQEQSEKDYSIPAQKEKLINYCRSHDWIIYDMFVDPGYSGGNLERPGIQRLIQEVKNFDIVLVYRLDRLSRNTLNSLQLVEEIFKPNGVTFVSLTENIDSSTPNGIMMLSFLASIAQNEKELLKERTKIGREGRAKKGLFHGSGIPIGYDYEEGQLTINEYEALQVKEAYSLYLQGHGVRKISQILKGKGYKHKYGNWSFNSTVNNVLTNPLYAGKIRWNGKEFDGQHDKIIEPEVFKQVQTIRNNRTNFNTKCFQSNSLLTGMLFCGICGGRYAIVSSCGKDKIYKYKYYTCYSRAKIIHMIKDPNCRNKTWKMEKLDSIIEKKILHLSIEEFSVKPPIEKKPNRGKEIIEKQIEELNKKINKLLDLYQMDSTIEIKEIGERIRSLHEEKKALEETLKKYKEEKEPVVISKEFKNFLTAIPEKWKNSDLQGKRRILEALIEKIVLKDEEVKIVWREGFCIPIQFPYYFD